VYQEWRRDVPVTATLVSFDSCGQVPRGSLTGGQEGGGPWQIPAVNSGLSPSTGQGRGCRAATAIPRQLRPGPEQHQPVHWNACAGTDPINNAFATQHRKSSQVAR